MATFIYPVSQVSIPGVATEATLLLVEQNTANTVNELQSVNAELNTQTTELQTLNAKDFATETTLAAAAADIALIEAKDFATETTLSALNAKVTAVDTGAVVVSSSALPTGASTEAKQDTIITEIQAVGAIDFATQTTLTSVLDEVQLPNISDVVATAYVAYSTTNLPGNASLPLQLVASSAAIIRKITLFDTGGAPCEIMEGPASSEVRKLVVGPGADTTISVLFPAGSRISIRRLDSASALAVGDLSINFIS